MLLRLKQQTLCNIHSPRGYAEHFPPNQRLCRGWNPDSLNVSLLVPLVAWRRGEGERWAKVRPFENESNAVGADFTNIRNLKLNQGFLQKVTGPWECEERLSIINVLNIKWQRVKMLLNTGTFLAPKLHKSYLKDYIKKTRSRFLLDHLDSPPQCRSLFPTCLTPADPDRPAMAGGGRRPD